MISSKRELRFYIDADRIMNGFPIKRTGIIGWLLSFLPHPKKNIILFLEYMRKCSYYTNSSCNKLLRAYYLYRYSKVSEKLGFSIDYNAFDYGLLIPHYGTIVVGGPNKIGKFSVLHTSTCIAGEGKTIGDFFYLSSGSQVVGNVNIGDGVSVAAHSLVNKNTPSNVLVAGAPAKVVKEGYPTWCERDGDEYVSRQRKVEKLAVLYGF